jgi:hypothetical protein
MLEKNNTHYSVHFTNVRGQFLNLKSVAKIWCFSIHSNPFLIMTLKDFSKCIMVIGVRDRSIEEWNQVLRQKKPHKGDQSINHVRSKERERRYKL